MSRPIDYDEIAGLIATAEQERDMMRCTFRCTISFESVNVTVPIEPQGMGTALVKRAQDRARQSIWYGIKRALLLKLRRMFGRGLFGQLVAELGTEALGAAEEMSRYMYSDEQLRAAKVRAFEQVSSSFRWDARMQQWVWAKHA